MNEPVEYRIVCRSRPDEVEREVSDLLGQGWECAGGISHDRAFYPYVWAQAMVLYPHYAPTDKSRAMVEGRDE